MLITLARKPLSGGVAQNALTHGTGALNVDAARIGVEHRTYKGSGVSEQRYSDGRAGLTDGRGRCLEFSVTGRWPANVLLDPTPAVLAHFPEVKGQVGMTKTVGGHRFIEGDTTTVQKFDHGKTDTGSAARFFKQVKGC